MRKERLGMDGARERGEEGSERRRDPGATERGSGAREERGRKGYMEGGKLQGRYPDTGTGQYTVRGVACRTHVRRCFHIDLTIDGSTVRRCIAIVTNERRASYVIPLNSS